MGNRLPLPSQDVLRQLFRYEPDTGKLFWRERTADKFNATAKTPKEKTCKRWNTKFAGKEAFTSTNTDGYFHGSIFGKHYKSHRIIFKLVHGVDPVQVDHKNGVRTDNRIQNLRSVTASQNNKNRRITKYNTSGFVGVTWVESRKKWTAYISSNNKAYKLGYFQNLNDAVAARKSANAKHGFHANHGRVV